MFIGEGKRMTGGHALKVEERIERFFTQNPGAVVSAQKISKMFDMTGPRQAANILKAMEILEYQPNTNRWAPAQWRRKTS